MSETGGREKAADTNSETMASIQPSIQTSSAQKTLRNREGISGCCSVLSTVIRVQRSLGQVSFCLAVPNGGCILDEQRHVSNRLEKAETMYFLVTFQVFSDVSYNPSRFPEEASRAEGHCSSQVRESIANRRRVLRFSLWLWVYSLSWMLSLAHEV